MWQIGDVFRFRGERQQRDWGDMTITRIEGSRVYAIGTGVEARSFGRDFAAFNLGDHLGGRSYEPIKIAEEPTIEEDWS